MNEVPILIDCDGVLADFVGATLAIAGQFSSIEWTDSRLTKFDYFDELVDPNCPDLEQRVMDAIARPGFCLSIPVLPGAHDAVARLRDVGPVRFVTSPWSSRTWHAERVEWLGYHFGANRREIVFAVDKSQIHGRVLVDDRASNVVGWQSYQDAHARTPGRGIVWDSFHNRTYEGERTSDWLYVVNAAKLA